MEEVGPHQVVSEILTLVGQNLREDSVDIVVNVPEDLRIRADFNRLEQVVLNLVMNSIHAIRKAIQGGRKTGHSVVIETTRSGDRVVLEVKDTGCGIAPANMKKLFQPFFTTKDIGEGTGLGLAIVAQLVHEMQGEISVQSAVDVGTTFRVVLSVVP
jgi:signal transduction histidine kinase